MYAGRSQKKRPRHDSYSVSFSKLSVDSPDLNESKSAAHLVSSYSDFLNKFRHIGESDNFKQQHSADLSNPIYDEFHFPDVPKMDTAFKDDPALRKAYLEMKKLDALLQLNEARVKVRRVSVSFICSCCFSDLVCFSFFFFLATPNISLCPSVSDAG